MYLTQASEIAEQFQFRNENIGSFLKLWVDNQPDKVFFHWHPFEGEGRAWTYREFWDDICALASGLQQEGIGIEDKVVIHSENCPEMVISWYACALIGAVAVTTNAGATPREMEHFITKTDAVAAITQPRYVELVSGFSEHLRWVVVTASNSDGSAEGFPEQVSCKLFADLFDREREVELAACTAMSPVGIVFTSGTTGLSKAVLHSHGNWLWASIAGPSNIAMERDDVMLTYMPFFHVNAQMWATATALGVGASMVLLPKVTVSRFWDIVLKYGVTHLSIMPLVVNGVKDDPVPENHRLKCLGLAELPALSEHWGARFHSIYGSSETVIHCLATNPRRLYPEKAFGRTVPGYQVQAINPDTGEPARPGEDGELWVRGTRGVQMFLEYYNDPDATENAFVDGWYRTGDLVHLRENGHFYFAGRLKDMIKVGGENVGVDEVESAIMQVGGIAEVAVVAKYDPALDEVPVAYIIAAGEPEGLEEKIFAHCREHLSAFKVPRHVVVMEEFPRAVLDKVAKNKLRDMANKL